MRDIGRREFASILGSSALAIGLTGSLAGPLAAAVPTGKLKPNLEAFRRQARALGVRAMVVATSDRVLLEDGAVSEPSRIASIRKSLLSALYGIAAAEGRIDLDATVASFGIDDQQPLSDQEKQATVRHLLRASSGIYLPTSAETPAMRAARPKRGSHAPGSFWYYNNWDFNVLGEIYQRATGEDLFLAIEHRFARPLGWRDFKPLEHTRWSYDKENPRFPAYNLWLSARDLARFGQLFLRRGNWAGKQIVPERWVRESTTPFMPTGRPGWGSGYGYMWWIASDRDGASPAGLPIGTYTAAGNGGRYITVFPDRDLVVAVQPDERPGQPPVPLYADPQGYLKLLQSLVRA